MFCRRPAGGKQRSSALHLNCSSPIRLILNRNSAKPLALANYVARQKGLVNQCSHQCLHWCQQQSTGLLHLNGSSPKKDLTNQIVLSTHQQRSFSGTPEGTRTPDLLLRRQLLYPTELLAHISGAGDGNRTRVSSLEGWCSTIELHPRIHRL